MKVRDLLIKIANGEDLPQKIKINKTIYELNDINSLDELYVEKGKHWYHYNFSLIGLYNNEVEILEEEKKIPEKLEILNANEHSKEVYYENYSKEEISLDIETLQIWVNKIIDYLKSKGDE